MRRNLIPILVLTVSMSGCSKQATAPAAAPPPLVPELVATEPPARSPRVLYDTDIWAQFDRSLDRHTVNSQNVYLKLDGQRVPLAVSYDDTSHRVTLQPGAILLLQRTYTVEFSTAVHGADGTPLAPGVFFQFTTNSLRRLAYDFPLDGDLEGPLVTLGWGGTLGPTNNIVYELYVSTDSLQVLARTAPLMLRGVLTRFLPAAGWPMGRTVYWAVTSENQTTHERLDASVRSFRTVDASAPLDSIVISASDIGSRSTTSGVQQCGSSTFQCGPLFNGAVHWNVAAIPADARLQGATARLALSTGPTNGIGVARPALWMAQNDWQACAIIAPGPPFPENTGFLASGTEETPTTAAFNSERLAAMLEAQKRKRAFVFGTLVRADASITFQSTSSGDPSGRPTAVVRFYRIPQATAP
jgi:hypothetical protein